MTYSMLAGYPIVLVSAWIAAAAVPWIAGAWLRSDDGARAHLSIGGIMVWVAVALATIAAAYIWHVLWRGEYTGLLIAGLLVAVAGLWDDTTGLRPWLKLSVQIAAAVVLVYYGYHLGRIALPFADRVIALGAFDLVLTVLVIVLLLNAVDFLEGLRGYPGVYASVIAVFLFYMTWTMGDRTGGLMLAALFGCILGLASRPGRHTFGHTGSQLVALIVASELLRANASAPSLTVLVMPIILFGIPIIQLARFHANRAVYAMAEEAAGTSQKPALAWARRPELVILHTWLPRLRSDAQTAAVAGTGHYGRYRIAAIVVLAAVTFVALRGIRNVNWLWLASGDVASNARMLIERDDTSKAIDLGFLASARNLEDPESRLWLARAYTAAGRTDDALETYNGLFATGAAAEAERGAKLQRHAFYPEARIDMGDLAVAQGRTDEALAHYILAEAFGYVPPNHPNAGRVFAEAGAWNHALRWGWTYEPSRAVSDEDALALVQALAYREAWPEVLEVAHQLRGRETYAADGAYWAGRAALAMRDREAAIASLASASALGHPDAPYAHVVAAPDLPRGVQIATLLQTGEQSPYRPFALVQALVLLQGAPAPGAEAEGAPSLETLEALARDAVFREPVIRMPYPQVEGRPRLLGITLDAGSFARGEPFLVTFHWNLPTADAAGPRVTQHGLDHVTAYVEDRAIVLRRVENLVPFGNLEQMQEYAGLPPGWPDRYATVPAEAIEEVFSVAQAGGSWALNVTSATPTRALAHTLPIAVRGGHEYLLAARAVSRGAAVVAGCEFYDKTGRPLQTANVFNVETFEQPRWRALRQTAPNDAATVRVVAGIFDSSGAAAFDAIVLVPLEPPVYP